MMKSSSICLVIGGVQRTVALGRRRWFGVSGHGVPALPAPARAKPARDPAERIPVTSRALALLAAFASPVFMVAAVAGWLFEVWPANPLTLGVAAFVVVGGPLLGIVHVATPTRTTRSTSRRRSSRARRRLPGRCC